MISSKPIQINDWLDGKVKVPDDYYEIAYSYSPAFECPEDSFLAGHTQWNKYAIGYRGKTYGIMLSREFSEVLE